MADVIQKVISDNDIKQGNVVHNASSPIINNYQTVEPTINEDVDISAVETKYTNRFK